MYGEGVIYYMVWNATTEYSALIQFPSLFMQWHWINMAEHHITEKNIYMLYSIYKEYIN